MDNESANAYMTIKYMNGWQNKHVLTDVKRQELMRYLRNYH